MTKDLWSLLAKWWELDILVCSNIAEWFEWLDSLRVPSKVRLFLEGVAGTLMWSIWNYRNNLIFSPCPPKKAVIWDSIVSRSFLWLSSRNPSCNFSWIAVLAVLVAARLKADNMIRVDQIVTIFLIESSIHILDHNRYSVDTSLIHLESRNSPIAKQFDVDSRRIFIHHCEY
nr:RNA-directed DNA polymerase, eukaryota [Tanacetum cinerariifolium]